MHFLDTFRGLSLAEIKAAKKDTLTPFARDMDNNLQCVDHQGNVVCWDFEEQQVVEHMNMTLGQYLESIRDKLLTHNLAFDEDLGLFTCK